jgi:hypothetical protein
MDIYKIILQEENLERTLELTALKPEKKNARKLSGEYGIKENGKDLGKLVFDKGEFHYEGQEHFTTDDINLIALSLTAETGKETIIEAEDDDLDDLEIEIEED